MVLQVNWGGVHTEPQLWSSFQDSFSIIYKICWAFLFHCNSLKFQSIVGSTLDSALPTCHFSLYVGNISDYFYVYQPLGFLSTFFLHIHAPKVIV